MISQFEQIYIYSNFIAKIVEKQLIRKILIKKKIKQIKRLFFVNKYIKKILCKNSKMLIINCIYKTNKYYISMFVIINHTLLKINFYIVITFLNDENKKNFD